MYEVLAIPLTILGICMVIFSIIEVRSVFKAYRSFKQNLESYYYQKISEVTNDLIVERAKGKRTTELLSLQMEVADLRAVKAKIDKMPVLPVSPVIKLYSYLAIIIPIFTLII